MERWVGQFAEVGEELAQASADCSVSFYLAGPTAFEGVVELVIEEGCGGRTGDAPTCGDDPFVLLLDDGIADAGISGGHLRTAMAQNGHDRLNPSATFGELGADGMAEPMRGHGGTALAIDQPDLAADDRQRFFE